MKRFVWIGSLVAVLGAGAVTALVLRDGDITECTTFERNPDGATRGVCPDRTSFNGVPSDNGSLIPKPEPTLTTAELRSVQIDEYRYRIWPRSEDVPNDGAYRFSAPHCGLEWMTDFDGSFWKIVDRKSYGKNGPSFFINSDRGIVTFEGNDSIVYRASTGQEVLLRRFPGPTVIQLCD